MRNPKGQPPMDSPETLGTCGYTITVQIKTTTITQKTKHMSISDTLQMLTRITNKRRVLPVGRENLEPLKHLFI